MSAKVFAKQWRLGVIAAALCWFIGVAAIDAYFYRQQKRERHRQVEMLIRLKAKQRDNAHRHR